MPGPTVGARSASPSRLTGETRTSSLRAARSWSRLKATSWLVEGSLLALLLGFALRLRLWNLDAYTGSFDEGIRSEQLLLMSAGYRPFREIFSSQGPLLLDALYPFYFWLGQTLEAARAGVVAFSIVGLVGAWWTARLISGPAAGLAAAGLLALSPGYLEASRLALAEVPTIAPALLAVAAALAFRRAGKRRWLLASGALCALALLIKPMVIHVAAPLVALLVTDDGRQMTDDRVLRRGSSVVGRRWSNLALFGGMVAGLCALVIWALGPAAVWENLVAYRSGAGHAVGSAWAENLRLIRNVMAQERPGLFALGALGVLLGLWRRPGLVAPIALWVAAIVSLFLVYGDLSDKHIVYLIPPLALLGGIGVGLLASTARVILSPPFVILSGAKDPGSSTERPRFFASLRMTTMAAILGLTALALYLWSLPALYRAQLHLVQDAERVAEQRRDISAELDMADVMGARVKPDGWVISDNPNAAFRARRLVIPSLVDTSGTRVDAGSLTADRVIHAVQSYQPGVIVTWSRRLGRLDELTRWLPENGYQLDRSYDGGWKLYVRSQ